MLEPRKYIGRRSYVYTSLIKKNREVVTLHRDTHLNYSHANPNRIFGPCGRYLR